ncbi:MAG TPA: hypothetical protein VE823_17505 [Geodermatophilus sp.]|jgi:hypothetical protein|nr:hypothetical protein [Geodermatophilus sp.]
MTSPRPETTDRTAKIEDKDTDKDQPKGLQLSATQVAAGALASVSSAVVASFFGLAGTLIGAALASVISTVSAALYSSSLRKTNEKLRTARSQLTGRQSPVVETTAAAAAPATPATKVLPAHLDPRRAPARRPRPRWTRVAVYAAAVFAIAMGVITGIELIGQKPVSALVGGTQTSQETTLGAITNTSSSSDVQQDEEEPSSPSTTTAPATETSAPTTGSDKESTSSDEDETSDDDRTGSATPTRTSEAQPTTSSKPTSSPRSSSGQSPSQDSSSGGGNSPAAGAEPTP